jgi:surface polysaccharide O-acyltransferase-like enzyme
MNLADARSDNRNYGIDLLRIVLMFLITLVHVLKRGGVLEASMHAPGPAFEIAWFLNAGALFSMDCFGLISGYVMSRARYRPSRIVRVWLQVFCYSFGIDLVFHAWGTPVSAVDLIKSATPILSKQYWYATAYFGLFLFMPFLNILLRRLSRKGLTLLCGICLELFSLSSPIWHEPYLTNRGFSLLWLTVLYVLGWYVGVYGSTLKIGNKAIYALIAAGFLATYLPVVTLSNTVFHNSVSPPVLLMALGTLVLASRARPCGRLVRAVRALSPAAFGIYLIHLHPLVKEHFLLGRFAPLARLNPSLMALGAIGASLAICALCLLIDSVRIAVFRWLRVKRLCEWIDEKLRPLYSALEA